ncbi:MAG TPA: dihydrofolate reductase family protein [Burkholderiaceae bacterium]|nr:dihydrofolate reductase family protein [Burkholderiaceae bacterium]
MSKLIGSINVTLDGCCDHRLVIADEELLRYATELLESAAGLLFGRVTYEMFREYWPALVESGSGAPAEVVFARALDAKPKYVVSRQPGVVGWNTAIVRGDDFAQEIRVLKQRVAGDLVVFGSPALARALVQSGEIEELHLLLQPIFAGHGPRIFEGLTDPLRLDHVESRAFRSGVILSRYVPRAGSDVSSPK